MVRVTMINDKDSGSLILKVKGHAGAGEKGHDLVCASVSILTYTVAQTLKYIELQGGLKKPAHINLSDGNALISCKPTDEYYSVVLNTYYVAEVGYSLLENNYPKYVNLQKLGETA